MKKKVKAKQEQIQQQVQEQVQEAIQEQTQEQIQIQTSLPETEFEKLEELKKEITENESQIIESEPKKKRGRKPKSETIEVPEIPEIDVSPILDIAVKRLPNPIPLSDTEKTLFNQTANKVFQKYSGNFKYIEELNLSLVLVSILYPRLTKTKSADEIS